MGLYYDIEAALKKRGFKCDAEKDSRTTYLSGKLSVSIYWDGDIITKEGIPNGFGIWWLDKDEREYLGHRPKDDKELDHLLQKAGYSNSTRQYR